MEITNAPLEMTPVQKRALEIYCESANIYTDYKPMTFTELSEKLEKENMPVGKSTLQRWSKKFDFKSYLDLHLQQITIADASDKQQRKALSVAVEKKLVDVKRNNELTAGFCEIMEEFIQQVLEDNEKGKRISNDVMKIAITGYGITGGREDKMLDRIANAGADKITSAEMLEQHKAIEIEIEDE
jgi:hypothetical protein